jgi:2-phosphoglycerate kinase
MDRVILIGGAPTVGKSYLARKIAEELDLPWISTDTVREQMRQVVRKEDYPHLFIHANATAETAVEFLTHNTAKEIVDHQNKESLEVWKGVEALINTDYVWGSFVVEGVAVLPSLISELKAGKKIKSIFLVDEDIERIKETIYTRGLWDDANKYPDSVKEKEVEWVLEFNNYIKQECQRTNLPVVYIHDRVSYINEVKSLING